MVENQFTLGALIAFLETYEDSENTIFREGFANPCSYRGYYDQVAFEPATNVSVDSMLLHARSALNHTFTGYKGGQCKMLAGTLCWLAAWGCEGIPMMHPGTQPRTWWEPPVPPEE